MGVHASSKLSKTEMFPYFSIQQAYHDLTFFHIDLTVAFLFTVLMCTEICTLS